MTIQLFSEYGINLKIEVQKFVEKEIEVTKSIVLILIGRLNLFGKLYFGRLNWYRFRTSELKFLAV